VSCIQHPASSPFVPLRKHYAEISEGNACAAALLSVFERWHDHRLRRGLSPWIYRSREQLRVDDLFGLFGRASITTALGLLEEWGFIESRRNPYHAWDRTLQYRFDVAKVEAAIGLTADSSESNNASGGTAATTSGTPPVDASDSTSSTRWNPSSNTREEVKSLKEESPKEVLRLDLSNRTLLGEPQLTADEEELLNWQDCSEEVRSKHAARIADLKAGVDWAAVSEVASWARLIGAAT
jgi:hypothetical protein